MIEKYREGRIPVTGGNVWFSQYGVDRPGIPLLVLHGGPGAPHDYLLPLAALSDERLVIFYDQLGCGNSDKPAGTALYTVEYFVEELGQVRKALGLHQVHILGQSWGTMLTVEYMLMKNPMDVKSLVLSGPFLSAPRFYEDQRRYIDELPEKIRDTILEHEASGNYSSPEYQDAMAEYYKIHVCRMDPWPDCLNRSMENVSHEVYGYMWGPSEFTMTGTLGTIDLTDRLREIYLPVLFTCGRYDESSLSTTAYYHKMLPGSEMVVFEDASHDHHLEKTEEYLRVVQEFLRKAEGEK